MKHLLTLNKYFESFSSDLSDEQKLFYYHCIGFLSLPVAYDDEMSIRGEFQQKNLSFLKDENARESTIQDFKNLLENQPVKNKFYVGSTMNYIKWLYSQLETREVPDITIKFELDKYRKESEKLLPKLTNNTVEPESLGKTARDAIKMLQP